MEYRILAVTPFQQNCSLIWCKHTQQAALIDPGGDQDKLIHAVEEQGVVLNKILLTHGHIDHVGAAATLAKRFNVPIYGPDINDMFLLQGLLAQSSMFGLDKCEPFLPQRWLKNRDSIQLGQQQLTVLHCPGHTPGHIVFFCSTARLAFVGDVIFRGSIGRTDLLRGDKQQLLHSIYNQLFPLGDDVTFIPGHGELSTLGYEKENNPFLRGRTNP